MKIKSIYIDGLHNAVAKTYEFGDIVYFFGHNGAGKSTILQAIQFGLLGYIPGTSKSSKEAILRHSPQKKIMVRLVMSDDTGDVIIERRLSESGSKVNVIPESCDLSKITSDLELPIFNFSEFVSQTANKLKDYFIKHILPTSNGMLDWKQILTDSIADCNFEDKDAIIEYGLGIVGCPEGTVLEQVLQANLQLKNEQSFNKSELQRLQTTINSLIFYDDYAGCNNLEELNSKLLAANALRDQLIKYDSAYSAIQRQTEQLHSLEERLEVLGGMKQYDELTVLLPQLTQRKDDLAKDIEYKSMEIVELRQLIRNYKTVIDGKGICPYANEPCNTILTKIENLQNEVAETTAQLREKEAELENLQNDAGMIKKSISECKTEITTFEELFNKISMLKRIGDLPKKPDTDKTVFDLDVEIKQLTDDITKLTANIKYNETIDKLTGLKYEAELQGTALAQWVKKTDINGLQTTLMQKPFEELATTLTEYLSMMYGNTGLKAHFNVSTKANSFSFGLIKDGIYIPYDLLSSGEKCLYTLALMMYMIKQFESPLKILICDDMFDHLDSQAIENTFIALKQIKDIQFIFAGVKECKNAEDVMITIS